MNRNRCGDNDQRAFGAFRNQTDTIPLLEKVMIEHYVLTADPVVEHKRRQQKTGQFYPEELFVYLVSRAPQIGNLT